MLPSAAFSSVALVVGLLEKLFESEYHDPAVVTVPEKLRVTAETGDGKNSHRLIA
tara:strand:+ start:1011 stop:1175 length:165 start_codon:yes stop_codon:yes gene_type:complete